VTGLARLPRLTAAARASLDDAAEGRDGFLLEGRKAVLDALANRSARVRRLWLSDALPDAEAKPLLDAARARGIPVGAGRASDLERASATASPQGALAVVEDAAVEPAVVLASERPVLHLDGLQDPGNVGAVFRVAAAFDAGGVLADDLTAHPLGLKALRASAGTALRVPYARAKAEVLLDAVAAARRPLWLLDAGGRDVFAVGRAPARLVLAVGSEGSGASARVRAAAAERVGIPISAGVESLNAAVAAGIALAVLSRSVAR
jgi:23S rRNA (guanosine2251-2'-O)-methyltransferase